MYHCLYKSHLRGSQHLIYQLLSGLFCQQKSTQIVTIKPGQLLDNNEFVMPSSGNIKVVLVDAATKEQIDFCEVKSASSRDLDDLF